jgi:hypothetical protein
MYSKKKNLFIYSNILLLGQLIASSSTCMRTEPTSVWYELERRPNKSWCWIIVSIVFGVNS